MTFLYTSRLWTAKYTFLTCRYVLIRKKITWTSRKHFTFLTASCISLIFMRTSFRAFSLFRWNRINPAYCVSENMSQFKNLSWHFLCAIFYACDCPENLKRFVVYEFFRGESACTFYVSLFCHDFFQSSFVYRCLSQNKADPATYFFLISVQDIQHGLALLSRSAFDGFDRLVERLAHALEDYLRIH